MCPHRSHALALKARGPRWVCALKCHSGARSLCVVAAHRRGCVPERRRDAEPQMAGAAQAGPLCLHRAVAGAAQAGRLRAAGAAGAGRQVARPRGCWGRTRRAEAAPWPDPATVWRALTGAWPERPPRRGPSLLAAWGPRAESVPACRREAAFLAPPRNRAGRIHAPPRKMPPGLPAALRKERLGFYPNCHSCMAGWAAA